ncbi:hypothetical protein GCM10011531_27070 [Aquaticitalea lipolytica]|uniref:Thioredoxin domain-containing protein n=1 Tax=Aquaticitalea lipolytica TaxID=1247562 RepID=A0A8J2TS57_9FLAO|nr:TlpA disulfide reductase family protein [Aquaticitalea lipolytica]GFZ93751.1 hypothetical protein GCM10011531_27070 [Aquaticitalea lipolytica]
MKKIILWIILINSLAYSQDYTYNLSNDFQSQFGSSTDMVALNPIFKLESDTIFNKTYNSKIKKFPIGLSNINLAYGFLYFTGNSNSVFENEIVFLVENYMSDNPILYFDKNGNLDFTDDGGPIKFSDNFKLALKNIKNHSASLHYNISKGFFPNDAGQTFKTRIKSLYPNAYLISPNYWITNQRLFVKVSKGMLNDKPITIYLFDEDSDGLFTANIDKIFIEPNTIELEKDVSSFSRKASLISNNATFLIYGMKFSLKNLDESGDILVLEKSNKQINKIYDLGDSIDFLSLKLINDQSISINDFLNKDKYILIEVGGTWCGGCIAQKPIISEIYESNKAYVFGVFANDTKATVEKYVGKHKIEWDIGLMTQEFKKRFGINSFPTYILISPYGKIKLIDINAHRIKSLLMFSKRID